MRAVHVVPAAYEEFTQGKLRKALAPITAIWPDMIQPSDGGRRFTKGSALALMGVLINHVNYRTREVMLPNGPGRYRAPNLTGLGELAGMSRQQASRVLIWLVEKGLLTKKPHGYLRATTWSFNWPIEWDLG